MTTFPKLKLTYFDSNGRAETIRLAFILGDIPFEDERLSREAFAQRKPSFVYKQVPVLEVDGVEYAQSQAILRYAGKLANLYPANDPMAALRIDEIVGGLEEFGDKIEPSFRETNPEKRKIMRLELANTTIPRYLAQVEARLAKLHASAHFDVGKIFIHDLFIYAYLQHLKSGHLDHIPTDIADKYTLLKASETKVLNNTKVQQWNAIHQITERKFKLTYFNFAARGEPIRLALTIGGIPFEDERIDGAELEKRRASLPFGQLPVLEVNGEVIAQSMQILRYVGAITGLYPSTDPVLALRVDEYLSLVDDIYIVIGTTFHIPDIEARVEARKKLMETQLGDMLAALDKRIAKWGGQFATGAQLTIADFAIYSQVANFKRGLMDGFPTTLTDKFANITRVYSQVRNHDKVRDIEWLAQY